MTKKKKERETNAKKMENKPTTLIIQKMWTIKHLHQKAEIIRMNFLKDILTGTSRHTYGA